MVADAFGSEERQLAGRAASMTLRQPIGKPIQATLFYTLMQVEEKLEKRIGQKMTMRVFSRPVYLGVKVGGRAVPTIGWGLLAYDAYRILRD